MNMRSIFGKGTGKRRKGGSGSTALDETRAALRAAKAREAALSAQLEQEREVSRDLADRLEESERLQHEAHQTAIAANHRADELEKVITRERRRTQDANAAKMRVFNHMSQARAMNEQTRVRPEAAPDPDQTVALFTIDVPPGQDYVAIPPMPRYKPTVGMAEVAQWAVDAGLVRRTATGKTITPDGDTVEMELPHVRVEPGVSPTAMPGRSMAVTWTTPTSSEDPGSPIRVVTDIVPSSE